MVRNLCNKLTWCIPLALLLLFPGISSAIPIVTVPSGLAPGDTYRLVFETSTVVDPTSSGIADYNDFVTAAANSSAELAALGTTWTAIASTESINASTNTATDPSVDGVGAPIFSIGGSEVASGNSDLWDGTIDSPIDVDETGSTRFGFVYTGTDLDGTADPSHFLGQSAGYGNGIGMAGVTSGSWIAVGSSATSGALLPMYGMSDVLTVPSSVPEPSTQVLLGFALIGLIGFSRKGRKA